MKKRFNTILDEASPCEAERLIHGLTFDSPGERTTGRVKQTVLERTGTAHLRDAQPSAVLTRSTGKRSPRLIRRFAAAAAAVVMLVGVFFGSRAYAEAEEFNKAAAFFNTHDILSDGLSRQQLKEVYRDISSERYALETTEFVLKESYKQGYSQARRQIDIIFYQAVGDTEGEDFVYLNKFYADGSYYYSYKDDIQNRYGIIKKRMNDIIWTYSFDNVNTYGSVLLVMDDGVLCEIVDGYTHSLVKLNHEGEVIWTKKNSKLAHFRGSFVAHADGSFSTIGAGSRVGGPFQPVEITHYTSDGDCIETIAPDMSQFSDYDTELGFFGLENGYAAVMQLRFLTEGRSPYEHDSIIILFDSNGTIVNTIQSDALDIKRGDNDYFNIEAVHEYNGKLYISGQHTHTIPRDTYDDMIDFMVCRIKPKYEQRVVDEVKANETACLLVYDPADGSINEVSRVSGALAYGFTPDSSDTLVWNVHGIEEIRTILSASNPYLEDSAEADVEFVHSSFVYSVKARLIQYCYDASGALVSRLTTRAISDQQHIAGRIPSLYDPSCYSAPLRQALFGVE